MHGMCSPKVGDLDVKFCHPAVDLLSRGSLAVQKERRALRLGIQSTLDDEVGLSLRPFQLDFNVTGIRADFHE